MATEEPQDPIEAYDSKHGRPEATPDKPGLSEADEWGTALNPVRETSTPHKNLQQVGK
jgi:hypothetical protein